MSATFTCPHCAAVYPFKPVLIGRAVRCTTCKNAFSLRADGIADKVGVTAPAPTAAAAAAAPAPAPRPAPAAVAVTPVKPPSPPPRPAAPSAPKPPAKPIAPPREDLEIEIEMPAAARPAASAPVPKPVAAKPAPPAPAAAPSVAKAPASKPAPTEATEESSQQSARMRASDRMTSQQKEARRNMAATLAVSMNAALKAESVKKESEVQAREEKKKASGRGEGGVGRIGPALLSNQGVEEAKLVRSWWLYSLGTIGLVVALGWLIGHHGPRQQAIDAFTAVVEGKRNRPGERVLAIQERAWLTTMPPANVGVPAITEMPDVHLGGVHAVKLAGLRSELAALKGLALIEPHLIWMPPKEAAQMLAEWTPETKPQAFVAALKAKGKNVVEHRALLAKLEAGGMGSDDVVVVDLFLRGHGPGGSTQILDKWLGGDVPDGMELSTFYGSAGTLIVEQGGQAYKTRTVPYSGTLLRFVGKGWEDAWRVLTLTTARN
jgi:hypothetical protein